jgi:hypothetical protein
MSMEKICYDEPDSCYSCNCTHENGEFIVCSRKRKSKCTIMFDQLHQTEDDMEIEYRRAVIRAKNCPNYKKRTIEFNELYALTNN